MSIARSRLTAQAMQYLIDDRWIFYAGSYQSISRNCVDSLPYFYQIACALYLLHVCLNFFIIFKQFKHQTLNFS